MTECLCYTTALQLLTAASGNSSLCNREVQLYFVISCALHLSCYNFDLFSCNLSTTENNNSNFSSLEIDAD